MSLAARANAQCAPDALALADDRRTISWAELDAILNRATNALLSVSLARQARAAVFAQNSAEALLAYLTCLHAGVSAVPVSSQLTAEELVYILQDSGAEILFTGPETLETALKAAREAGGVRVIAWRSPAQDGVTDWESWLARASNEEPPSDMPAGRYLQYTSGTTGRPKAIEAVAATLPPAETVEKLFESIRAAQGYPPDGPHLVVGPLYHNAPLGSVRLLAAGTPIIVLPRFEAEAVLAAIEARRIASTVMVPTHFQRLLALPKAVRDRYDISSLKMVAHTGAACATEVKAAMIEWFGPILLEAYGGTESGPTNIITSEEWLKHPGSVGRTLEVFELLILDDNGEQLGPNQIGTIYFKDKSGRGIVYKNDPEKTKSSHISPGVFTLGEVGYYEEEGYLYITDRISDMIVSGGVNIYPAEVEQVLLRHDEVVDAVVIGAPNPDMGEEVKALVIPKDLSAPPTFEALNAYCREHLAAYKCPRSIEFVADVGRNAVGKVNKKAVRAAYWPTDRTIGG
jgi:acyl-CoA synthetase (AMP-forming)/AMP-acid ligase II